jgi:predicted membrane-bound spermidine synthase
MKEDAMPEATADPRPPRTSRKRAFAAASAGVALLTAGFLGAMVVAFSLDLWLWGALVAAVGALAGGLAFAAIAPAVRFRVWMPLSTGLSLLFALMSVATALAISCSDESALVIMLTSALIAAPIVAAAAAGAALRGRYGRSGRRP